MLLSESEPLTNTIWQEQAALRDEEFVLGANAVIYEASSWCSEEEETCSIISESTNGSSDGASCNGVPWSGSSTHPFDSGKGSPDNAWRTGAVRGVEHSFNRGKSLAFAAWRRWLRRCRCNPLIAFQERGGGDGDGTIDGGSWGAA